MIVTRYSRSGAYPDFTRRFIKVLDEEELQWFLRAKIEAWSFDTLKEDDWRLTNDILETIVYDFGMAYWNNESEEYLTFDSKDRGEIQEEVLFSLTKTFSFCSILENEEDAPVDLIRIVGCDFEVKIPKKGLEKKRIHDLQVALCEALSVGKEKSYSSDSYSLFHPGWHVRSGLTFNPNKKIRFYFPDFLTQKITLSASVSFEEDTSQSDDSDDQTRFRFTTM